MTDADASDYYRRREQTQRWLADDAASPAIAAIHRDMAKRYSELTLASERRERDAFPTS